MSHWIYFLIGAVAGFFSGGVATYLLVCSHHAKKVQQQKIIRFVRAMKRLSKTGQYPMVKESIRKFAKQCINFNAESFRTFRRKEFHVIADCVSVYQNQGLRSTYDDGIHGTHIFQEAFDNRISEDETRIKICKNFCQIIGV